MIKPNQVLTSRQLKGLSSSSKPLKDWMQLVKRIPEKRLIAFGRLIALCQECKIDLGPEIARLNRKEIEKGTKFLVLLRRLVIQKGKRGERWERLVEETEARCLRHSKTLGNT
jgi:hypothetical protein